MQETTLTSLPTQHHPAQFRLGIASGDWLSPKQSHDGIPRWGGAGWARLGQYIGRLELPSTVGVLTWHQDHFYIRDITNELIDVDVIILQRLMHEGLADKIKEARAYGQIIINELDDWYWGLDTANAAFASSHPKTNPKENRNHYKGVLGASDAVFVSTEYIRDRISPWVRCPIVVLPNTIDVAAFTPVEPSDSRVPRVGWVGSTSHRSGDLETVRGIIKPMVDAGEITFQHSGHHDLARGVHDILGLSADQVLRVPLVEPHLYPSSLTMEIGIAPLRDTPFNHAKSDIKALEYSAAGIPWIGAPMTSYKALVETWGVGRLAKNGQQWRRHITELSDPEVRRAEGALLREKAWARDVYLGAHALRQSLFEVFSTR